MTDQTLSRRSEPNIAWHLLFSLVLHAAVIALFSGVLPSRPQPQPRPVYYVDLSRLPVPDPQAGRPDGGPAAQAGQRPEPKPKTTVQRPTPPPAAPEESPKKPVTKAAPVTKPVAKTRPDRKAVKKLTKARPAKASAGQQVKAAPADRGSNYSTVQQRLAQMRRKQQHRDEVAALKNKIAALSGAAATTGSGSGRGAGIPLGSPDGTGSDIGVDQKTWLKAFYKENWSLSKYQVSRLDLKATVSITYDAEGRLLNYRFIKPSGNANFDDSVKKAILKDKVLPFKPGRPLLLEDIEFNLKDLMD